MKHAFRSGWLAQALLLLLAGSMAFARQDAVPRAAEEPPANAAAPELVLKTGHVGQVMTLAFSADNRLVASGGRDRAVKLWDARTGALRFSLTGHRGAIDGVAFAASGAILYSVEQRGLVRGWDTHDGGDRGVFDPPQPTGLHSAIWCGGKGNTLLVASALPDNSVALWKVAVATGKTEPLGALDGHTASVRCLAFSPDGKHLASGATNGEVKLWDTSDGSLERSFREHAMPIHGLAFSADSQTLSDASEDGIATLFNLKTGKPITELSMNPVGDAVDAVAFAPDGRQIATGGWRGTRKGEYIKLWDGGTHQENRTLKGHDSFVSALAFSGDGAVLASGSRDTTVRLWNAHTGQPLEAIGNPENVAALAYSPDGKMLASGSADHRVRLWDAPTGVLRRVLEGHSAAVRAVVFTPDGAKLVSGGKEGQIITWDAKTGALLKTLKSDAGPVNALAFSPDGTALAAGCGAGLYDGSVRILDFKTGQWGKTLDGQSLNAVRGVAYTPDGGSLVTVSEAGGGGEVRFWDPKTGMLTFKEFGHGLDALALSANGKLLVTGGAVLDDQAEAQGDELQVWNARTQTLQKTAPVSATGGWIHALAFLPPRQNFGFTPPKAPAEGAPTDPLTVVSGSGDQKIRFWNARTGETLRTVPGHLGGVLALAMSPDGRSFATAGADNTIKIWSLPAAELLGTLVPVPADPKTQDFGDWLAVTPKGFYDGSAGAERRISWRIRGKLFPVEAFAGTFHKPGELNQALETDPLNKPAGSGAGSNPASAHTAFAASVPPDITFNAPEEGQAVSGDHVNVKISVTSAEKVNQVEVLSNGRPVGAKPIQIGAKAIEIGAKPIEVGAKPIPVEHKFLQQFQVETVLPPGETQITLSARAVDSGGLTAREELHLTRGGAGAAAGNLYVLAVGVSKYQNPKYDLKYAAPDAVAFADLWTGQTGGLYRKVDTVRLTDAQATTANIRAALLKLLEVATVNDSVTIFLSGHGLFVNGSDYYFAAHDIDASNVGNVIQSALPWTALQTTLAALKAKRVVMFLDACHSGNALGQEQSSSERMAELLVKRAGVMVFSSSRGSEFSYELEDLHHGAFTAAIMEGIAQGKADFEVGGQKTGVITAEGLLAYLRARVPQMTGNMQTPTCPLLRDFGEAAPLARTK